MLVCELRLHYVIINKLVHLTQFAQNDGVGPFFHKVACLKYAATRSDIHSQVLMVLMESVMIESNFKVFTGLFTILQ